MATLAPALIFLTLIGGIVATTWQARKARAEKARAERRFNDVRQLARSVLFDYHDAIKDLPGATRVREQLVKDALTYLDSLAGEATGDPDLLRSPNAMRLCRDDDFRGTKVIAHSTKANASSAIISKFPARASTGARVPSRFRPANAGTGSKRQSDVQMPPVR